MRLRRRLWPLSEDTSCSKTKQTSSVWGQSSKRSLVNGQSRLRSMRAFVLVTIVPIALLVTLAAFVEVVILLVVLL